MKYWCKFLPLIFVEWWAKRNCQQFCLCKGENDEQYYVMPFKGVIFITKD